MFLMIRDISHNKNLINTDHICFVSFSNCDSAQGSYKIFFTNSMFISVSSEKYRELIKFLDDVKTCWK